MEVPLVALKTPEGGKTYCEMRALVIHDHMHWATGIKDQEHFALTLDPPGARCQYSLTRS